MTFWRRSFVIYPVSLTSTDDIPKVSPCYLASKLWPILMIGWCLHKGRANLVTSNRPLRLYAIQWRSRNDNLIPWQVGEAQIVLTAGNTFQLRRQWEVKCYPCLSSFLAIFPCHLSSPWRQVRGETSAWGDECMGRQMCGETSAWGNKCVRETSA